RGGDPALREATGDLVSKSTTRCGRRDAGRGRRVDARRVRGAPGAGPPHRGALARRDPSRIPHPASRSMRIGITCYPTYGGSGAVATELGLELARRGHEIPFVSYASPFRLRDETYRAFGCGQCDLRVIPNFISTVDYHPPTDDAFRKRLAPKGHRILVHVSNFRPVKRVGDVVQIFAAVRKTMPATLVLVGDGPDRDAIEHQVDGLSLRKNVRFLGKVETVGDVLRGADLFLLPSATESFGLAALEAMA